MSTRTETDSIRRAISCARTCPDSWIPIVGDLDAESSLDRILDETVPTLFRDHDADTHLPAGTEVIEITSRDYPDRLRSLARRPLLLFVQGRLPSPLATSLAIVGTRHPTARAREDAYHVAMKVAAAGHPIISGLAQGIDTAAHQGALAAGGVTVAVMGTGPDMVFPTPNADLAVEIKSRGGATVTQFAPGQGPSKTTFPARNQLIAGLSDASLLIELNERSGTRIEAESAIEQSKPVWLWGPLMRHRGWTAEFAERDGVDFVDSIDEIVERLDKLR